MSVVHHLRLLLDLENILLGEDGNDTGTASSGEKQSINYKLVAAGLSQRQQTPNLELAVPTHLQHIVPSILLNGVNI